MVKRSMTVARSQLGEVLVLAGGGSEAQGAVLLVGSHTSPHRGAGASVRIWNPHHSWWVVGEEG